MATTATEMMEHERLFGNGVDLFKNCYAVEFLLNIMNRIGLAEINYDDWYKELAKYLTQSEIVAMYDKLIPPDVRKKISGDHNRRNPPELSSDDSPYELLEYIGRNIVRRRKMWMILSKVLTGRLEEYRAKIAEKSHVPSALEKRFAEMRSLFELSDIEMKIVLFVFFSTSDFMELGDFDLGRFNGASEKINNIARAVNIRDFEVADLLSDKHNIGRFGLFDEDLDMDHTFRSYLSGISSKPLSERFWTKYSGEILPWNFYGVLAEKHGRVLEEMIRSKTPDSGVSALLYGVAGSGKSSFAASLAAALGKDLYFIAQNDNDSRKMSYSPAFRYAALAVAQKQLDPEKCILAVDECDKMVENSGLGGGFLRMLGIESPGSRDGETKGQLNTVIDENRHVVLWICNSKADAIDPSSLRRFDYSIYFDDLSVSSRIHIWENALKFHGFEGRLSKCFLDRISMRYRVNPGGVAVAVKNAAALCRKNPELSFENEVMVFLKAHCALLGIQESPEETMEPARDYSLEGLNIKSGIKLPRLIEVCRSFLKTMESPDAGRDQPRMNLLLFGVPGSGKTEFVKYLAKQLDKKLCVKNASDLLNKYVGGTEERLAAAFAEAESNGDILFMDEGDSLLSSREGAVRSWEVSQVNTLLSEMERFRGIFIVGTNLVQRIDPAALRRFSFRLHFDYLDNRGKEVFYNTYFVKPLHLPGLTEAEKKILAGIDSMTPSDFRNVRQQFFYLEDKNLSNEEVLEAIAAEIQSKNSGTNYTGLGKLASRIGF